MSYQKGSLAQFWGTAGETAVSVPLNGPSSNGQPGGPAKWIQIKHRGAAGTANLFVNFVPGATAALRTVTAVDSAPAATNNILLKPTETLTIDNVSLAGVSVVRDETGTDANFEYEILCGY